MPSAIVADTQAVVWYLADSKQLSAEAFAAIDEACLSATPVHVSSITLIELTYLIERRRIPQEALAQLMQHLKNSDSAFTIAPVDILVAEAVATIPRKEIADMPDRIIGATAVALGLPLVTKDRALRDSQVETIW